MTPALAGFLSTAYAQTLLAIGAAFVLGGAIGFERQWRQRSAGLRTTVLVAVGAAAFTDLGVRLLGAEGATRIVGYVISGIGFLGAGVILKDGGHIRGLNTAATLWCSAAVGAFAGVGMAAESATLAIFVLAGNTLLRPLANWVNRRPVRDHEVEATYRVHATAAPADVSAVRDRLYEVLEAAHYPVREIELLSDSDDHVELAAVLAPSEAVSAELDAAVDLLERTPAIRSATWSSGGTD